MLTCILHRHSDGWFPFPNDHSLVWHQTSSFPCHVVSESTLSSGSRRSISMALSIAPSSDAYRLFFLSSLSLIGIVRHSPFSHLSPWPHRYRSPLFFRMSHRDITADESATHLSCKTSKDLTPAGFKDFGIFIEVSKLRLRGWWVDWKHSDLVITVARFTYSALIWTRRRLWPIYHRYIGSHAVHTFMRILYACLPAKNVRERAVASPLVTHCRTVNRKNSK